MKRAMVYVHDRLAGRLTEDEGGFTFEYDAAYLDSGAAEAVSLTLPLRREPYRATVLFPFFDGLIPEAVAARHSGEKLEDKPPGPYVAAAGLLQGLHRGRERSG